MNKLKPDDWIVLEFEYPGIKETRILCTWHGDYLNGESWRLSTDIKNVEFKQDEIELTTESGQKYILVNKNYGTSAYMNDIIALWRKEDANVFKEVDIFKKWSSNVK